MEKGNITFLSAWQKSIFFEEIRDGVLCKSTESFEDEASQCNARVRPLYLLIAQQQQQQQQYFIYSNH